ncbi:MAG: hypothetical protein ACTSUE_07380 [Promethearchaeota archaeon]
MEENRFSMESLRSGISNRMRVKFHLSLDDGNTVEPLFHMVPLTEEKRYGRRSTIIRDEENRLARECYIAFDSRIFPRRSEFEIHATGVKKSIAGGISYVPVDEAGDAVRRSEIKHVHPRTREEMPRYSSNLYSDKTRVIVPLEERITLDGVLDIDVERVYVLFPSEESSASDVNQMMEHLVSLESGSVPNFIYTRFCLRESLNQYDGFLQVIEDDLYFMLGFKKEVIYYGYDKNAEVDDNIDVDEGEGDDEFKLEFGF